jgi:hypothetical protein
VLHDHRAHEQAAVARAQERQALGRRVAGVDQVLRTSGEVVEDVLLAVEGTRAMPGIAELTAAPDVRDREDAAALGPCAEARAKDRGLTDAVPAVP